MPRLDPQSLGEHLNGLYRAAWALCGSREDAEDLVQDTFARVLAKPRVIRGDERAYLMATMRNTFYSRVRSASRRPRTAATLEDVEPADPRPGVQPDSALEFGELLGAIAELPEDFRLALAAVDILGLSYGEAARALGAREATITTRVYRARQRVVRRISEPPATEPQAREGKPPGRGLD
ncbi:MAG: RNA polymerase sigma factor [Solirubrobacteraceae bacterium]